MNNLVTQFKRKGKFDDLRHKLYLRSRNVDKELLQLVERKIDQQLEKDPRWMNNKGKTVGLVTGQLYKDDEIDKMVDGIVEGIMGDSLKEKIRSSLRGEGEIVLDDLEQGTQASRENDEREDESAQKGASESGSQDGAGRQLDEGNEEMENKQPRPLENGSSSLQEQPNEQGSSTTTKEPKRLDHNGHGLLGSADDASMSREATAPKQHGQPKEGEVISSEENDKEKEKVEEREKDEEAGKVSTAMNTE